MDQANAEYSRSLAIREKAGQAAMAQASREAVNRAVKASTHQFRDWRSGQCVYVYRRGKAGNVLHPRDGLVQESSWWRTTAPSTERRPQ